MPLSGLHRNRLHAHLFSRLGSDLRYRLRDHSNLDYCSLQAVPLVVPLVVLLAVLLVVLAFLRQGVLLLQDVFPFRRFGPEVRNHLGGHPLLDRIGFVLADFELHLQWPPMVASGCLLVPALLLS